MTRLSGPVRFVVALAMVATTSLSAMAAGPDRPLRKVPFNPEAKQVDLFEAMEAGEVTSKVIAKNSLGGNLLIANNTDEPLNVKVPNGFVVLPSAQMMGGMMGGMGGMGGGMMGGMGGMGGMQAAGGGMGGMGGGGMGGGGMGGGGMGLFSVPPQKTVSLSYTSVCLEHGKKEPNPRVEYAIIPTEKFTQDPMLIALVEMVGTGKLDSSSAQAAAWHLANGMSWQELATKTYNRVAAPNVPYFHPAQLMTAQNIVATAKHVAEENIKNGRVPAPVAEPRTRASR